MSRVTEVAPHRSLVRGCMAGDPEALRLLMERYGAQVRRLLGRLVSDPLAAEGLVQETFLKAFRNMDKFREGTNLPVWLLTVARNTAYDHLRREKAAVKPVELSGVPEPVCGRDEPPRALLQKEVRERVRHALRELPAKEQAVVVLRIYDGLTWDAIGSVLGIAEATARARASRALERLRSVLNPMNPSPEGA